jgi:hypothetical protein
MSIEGMIHKIEGDWWFDLGISYNKTYYHHTYRRVVTIAVAFFSIYIRWKNK